MLRIHHDERNSQQEEPWTVFVSSMPQQYYFLVGSLSFIAGLYVDQNYNVPDIKYWVKHAEDVVCIFQVTDR